MNSRKMRKRFDDVPPEAAAKMLLGLGRRELQRFVESGIVNDERKRSRELLQELLCLREYDAEQVATFRANWAPNEPLDARDIARLHKQLLELWIEVRDDRQKRKTINHHPTIYGWETAIPYTDANAWLVQPVLFSIVPHNNIRASLAIAVVEHINSIGDCVHCGRVYLKNLFSKARQKYCMGPECRRYANNQRQAKHSRKKRKERKKP